MASEQEKSDAVLRDYELALEDLTFNSKPIINDLTMAADKYKPIAPKIVEKIEARIFEVAASLWTILLLLAFLHAFFESLFCNFSHFFLQFYVVFSSGRNTVLLVLRPLIHLL